MSFKFILAPDEEVVIYASLFEARAFDIQNAENGAKVDLYVGVEPLSTDGAESQVVDQKSRWYAEGFFVKVRATQQMNTTITVEECDIADPEVNPITMLVFDTGEFP